MTDLGNHSAATYHKPHIGTDVLAEVVKHMREEIIRLGGTVRFDTQVTDLLTESGQVCGVKISFADPQTGALTEEEIHSHVVVLAIGHSARDTFSMLLKHHRRPKQRKHWLFLNRRNWTGSQPA